MNNKRTSGRQTANDTRRFNTVQTRFIASLYRLNHNSHDYRICKIAGYAANESGQSMNQVHQGSDGCRQSQSQTRLVSTTNKACFDIKQGLFQGQTKPVSRANKACLRGRTSAIRKTLHTGTRPTPYLLGRDDSVQGRTNKMQDKTTTIMITTIRITTF